ncbi:hypothetical protein ABZV34_27010 [Streptomyces sp. NPDC005195]|uniref:hypothetical protein n=1 Tax=Streptomyces sp. NPDC005195 TaxID=3154561 RepID=UPI0033B8C450
MSGHPEVIRPDDASIEAAMDRTLWAIAALWQALGDGEHTLNLIVERTDGVILPANADVSLGASPVRMAVLDEAAYQEWRTLLVFALEGSTVRSAVLIATTATEPHPRTWGWTVRDAWLHPMPTAQLRDAVIPCADDPTAITREVSPAPALLAPKPRSYTAPA